MYGHLCSSGDSDKGVVGRNGELFKGLPDTVSQKHFSIEWDKDGSVLSVHNLNPTNSTILLPVVERDITGGDDELEAAIAMHPDEAELQRTVEDLALSDETDQQRVDREQQLRRAYRRRQLVTQRALQQTIR